MTTEMIGIIAGTTLGVVNLIWNIKQTMIQKKNEAKVMTLESEISTKRMISNSKYELMVRFKRKVGLCFASYRKFDEFLKTYNYYEQPSGATDRFFDYFMTFSAQVSELVDLYYVIRSEVDDNMRISSHEIIKVLNRVSKDYDESIKISEYQAGYSKEYLSRTLMEINNKIELFNSHFKISLEELSKIRLKDCDKV